MQRDAAVTPEGEPAVEPEPTLREWFIRNLPTLLVVAALFVLIYIKLDVEGMWSIAKAALGLGFVIFIHELGHFAVAKWCDVHVETFSVGFGPPLPGCSFQWGETTYKLALFPLGGYVKMVGEGAEGDEGDDDPRSFKNKTVWQRMAIISAGVTMNVILAFVCFIVVFQGGGIKRPPGEVGLLEAGAPAWIKGIPSGAVIHQIGGVREPLNFMDLTAEVMSTRAGEKLTVVYSVPPDTERRTLEIEPRREEEDSRPLIGLSPPEGLQLVTKRLVSRDRTMPVLYQSAAADAKPPFEFGDIILGCTDPDRPDKEWTPLPKDPRNPEGKGDPFVLSRRMQLLAGKDMVFRVRRENGEEVSIKVPRANHVTFGARMRIGPVTAVREDSPAEKAGVQKGDSIKEVVLRDGAGEKARFLIHHPGDKAAPAGSDYVDPVRLPYELRKWADGRKEVKATLTVLRPQNKKEGDPKTLPEVAWDGRDVWRFGKEVPIGMSSPLAVPELGVAYRVETTVEKVVGPPATGEDGLKDGDVIKAVRFWDAGKDPANPEPGSWLTLEPQQWARVFYFLQTTADVRKVTLRVERKEQTQEIDLVAREDKDWPLDDRGLLLMQDLRPQRADSFGEAIVMGLKDTKRSILQVYLNLRGMITGRISVVKNLGGPITIARVAYKIAGVDIWEFLFFLGMISINLAVINFLPVPVLDGGHMVFLIYEKLRGKPASEEVRAAATYAGLLLLASLMVFVIYLDVSRLW
jgi:regulator of sigma E protease